MAEVRKPPEALLSARRYCRKTRCESDPLVTTLRIALVTMLCVVTGIRTLRVPSELKDAERPKRYDAERRNEGSVFGLNRPLFHRPSRLSQYCPTVFSV